MSEPDSVPHLTAEMRLLRDELEPWLVSLEGIDFAGVAFAGKACHIMLGSTQLALAQAQLIVINARLEHLAMPMGIEDGFQVVLSRGTLARPW